MTPRRTSPSRNKAPDDVWVSRRRHPTARPTPTVARSNLYTWLVGLIAALNFVGLMMVLTASSVSAFDTYGSSWYIARLQFLWVMAGAVICLGVSRLDYRRWRKLAVPMLVMCISLLVLVLVPGVGVKVNGARRWFALGPLHLQPSELAKIALVLFLANLLDRRVRRMDDWRATVKPTLVVFIAIAVLLMLEPNLGTTLVMGIVVLSMLFAAGAPVRPLAIVAVTGCALATLLAVVAPYRMARVMAFLDPWATYKTSGYQNIQSLVGVASGGLTGTGIGGSRAKWGFLPEAHTDFIFAVIGEEFGLIGALVVVGLFAALCVVGVRVVILAPDRFGSLVAAGITVWFGAQAFVNIGAVLGLLPITGLPLPFVSYGGTALVVSMASAGILLNVARQAQAPLQPGQIKPPRRRVSAPTR
ncbi:MAG: putative lipid II flippase FtsW [Acidimicrobiia bacterium]|nr:putative lipid II flippase FtsW [Acidimicrobiia bacterium]